MELHKIPTDEIRGFDNVRSREVATQIRRELLQVRMDIFSSRAQHSAKIRGLKKTLARILTVTSAAAGAKPAPAKPAKVAAAKVKANATAKVKAEPAKSVVKEKKTVTKK